MIRPLAVPRPILLTVALSALLLTFVTGIFRSVVAQESAESKPVAAATEKPAIEKSAADSGQPTQFTKNVSPSGLALGVLDSKVDGGGLPEVVEKLAQEGALASADLDWKKAREAYLKMIQAAPRNALAYANLGIVEYRLENFEAARTALNRSLQLNPSIAQNWMTLGLTYHKEGNYELAISALAHALYQDPKDPRTHLYMALAIYDYGWGSAAETELLRAIELDPNYTEAHFNLALMYLDKKPSAVELARRHYYVAIDLGAKRDMEVEKQLTKAAETAATKDAAKP